MAILGRIVWNILLAIGISVLIAKAEQAIRNFKIKRDEKKKKTREEQYRQSIRTRFEEKGWRVIDGDALK